MSIETIASALFLAVWIGFAVVGFALRAMVSDPNLTMDPREAACVARGGVA